MASAPPQILRENVREYLRQHGEPIKQKIMFEDQGDAVRMSLIKAAYEQYDEIPKGATEWYDPNQNVVVIDLPDPAGDDEQSTLGTF